MIRAIVENWGKIDLWINANAIFHCRQGVETSEEGYGPCINEGSERIFFNCREVGNHMIAGGGKGVIVNIVPISDFGASPDLCDYLATRNKIASCTRKVAEELIMHDISLFTVAPVSVHVPPAGNLEEEVAFKYAMPDDIARLVLLCISGLSDIMTGKLITLNGKRILSI
jgi:NAD(P)-dependent dehydrogenase (short-subunit alcohol dehydrogenase family)